MSVQLPGARATFVGSNGVPTPEFYRFLQGLQLLQADNASQAQIDAINVQLAELQAEIDALPEGEGYPILRVVAPILSSGLLQNGFAILSLAVAHSIDTTTGVVQLENDADPGATYFYGTDGLGVKGWQQLPVAQGWMFA